MVGFNAKNKDDLDPLYRCPSCKLLLREPYQLSCGHRQCKTCTDNSEGEIVKCAECSEVTLKNEIMLDQGFRNDMKPLQIICLLCEWDGSFKDYEGHLDQAHPNRICKFCGKTFATTIELNEHRHKECIKMAVPCTFTVSGCSDSVNPNQSSDDQFNFSQSLISNPPDHLGVGISNTQNERLSEMEIGVETMVSGSIQEPTNENISPAMQQRARTINTFTVGLQTLDENRQLLINQTNELRSLLESLKQYFATLRPSIEEQNTFLSGVRSDQEILQQDVGSLKQEVDDMQYVSYDGTTIWRITNFREKMMDAQSERQTSIYSPPFYSSPTGYKMRARLYLHGDGNARRTHMSLFFVLMRGPNDAILKFPFNYKVTFCLYDQTPHQRHIIDSFRPDIESSSFQRPQSEMNIASGIPKFFPLAMIQQEGNPYIRDDTMFIKVMVDFGDMPKTLLSYALSLNPGLPMHIQQMMIKQEAERRAQQQQSDQTPISPTNRPITMILPPNDETQTAQTSLTIIPPPNVNDNNSEHQDPANSNNN